MNCFMMVVSSELMGALMIWEARVDIPCWATALLQIEKRWKRGSMLFIRNCSRTICLIPQALLSCHTFSFATIKFCVMYQIILNDVLNLHLTKKFIQFFSVIHWFCLHHNSQFSPTVQTIWTFSRWLLLFWGLC